MDSDSEMTVHSHPEKESVRVLRRVCVVVVSLGFMVAPASCATAPNLSELGGHRFPHRFTADEASVPSGSQAPLTGHFSDFASTGCSSSFCGWPIVGAFFTEPEPEHRQLGASHMLGKVIETAGVAASDLLRPHLGVLAAGVNTYFPQAVASLSPRPLSGGFRQDDPSNYALLQVLPPLVLGGGGETVSFPPVAGTFSRPPGLYQDDVADLSRGPFISSTSSVRESLSASSPVLSRVAVLRNTLPAAAAVIPRPRASRVELGDEVSRTEQDLLHGNYSLHSNQEVDDTIFTKVDDQRPENPTSLSTDARGAPQQNSEATGLGHQPVGYVLQPNVGDDLRNAVSGGKWVEDNSVDVVREGTMKRLKKEIDGTAEKRKASLASKANEPHTRAAEGLVPILFNPDVANAAAAGLMIECKNPVLSVPLGGSVTLHLRGLDNDIYQIFLSGVMSSKQDIELDVWNSAGIYYEDETRAQCQELGTSKLKFFIAGKPQYELIPKVIYFCSATIVCIPNQSWKAPFYGHMSDDDRLYLQRAISSQ
uniref:Uncharacterized protein n=1 Tax=Toxoplasma gondii (strain ATCC 50861 / VEG) TaxID=432359 RepID=A0A0F7UQE3_TOXGV|nr:TPA: hypothetical protein BN1205_056930 [Toxoplasma gondii VEG]